MRSPLWLSLALISCSSSQHIPGSTGPPIEIARDGSRPELGPFASFRSEPTIFFPILNLTSANSQDVQQDKAGREYIFFAPRTLFAETFGPIITDAQTGELVWSGNASVPGTGTMDFSPCDFGGHVGSKYLCMTRARPLYETDAVTNRTSRKELGMSLVLDESYSVVYSGGHEAADYETQRMSKVSSLALGNEDDSYKIVPRDGHEFYMLPGGESYLVTMIRIRPWDLRPYAPPPATHESMTRLQNGYVKDACFKHISTSGPADTSTIFAWCALDAYPDIDAWEPHVWFDGPDKDAEKSDGKYRDGAGGLGRDVWGWDIFHQNSVDLDRDGNYIFSARHIDSILLIAGPRSTTIDPLTGTTFKTGEVIWKLTGTDGGDFEMIDATVTSSANTRQASDGQRLEWTFARQHHARELRALSNETHLVMSMFDNGWNDRANVSGRASSGIIIAVSKPIFGSTNVNNTGTATLIRRCYHPDARGESTQAASSTADLANTGAGVSIAQGSTQILENGNMVVGWGTVPEMTEFSETCDVVWHAHLGPPGKNELTTYRVFRSDWTARPNTKPKVTSYRRSCGPSTPEEKLTTTAYVSWNGATEAVSWRFMSLSLPNNKQRRLWPFSKPSFDWKTAGTVRKDGFETAFVFDAIVPSLIRVEALDGTGRVLATSDATPVFVPSNSLRDAGRCTAEECMCGDADVEGCTTNGPEKHFIYSMDLSQACTEPEVVAEAAAEKTFRGSIFGEWQATIGVVMVIFGLFVAASLLPILSRIRANNKWSENSAVRFTIKDLVGSRRSRNKGGEHEERIALVDNSRD